MVDRVSETGSGVKVEILEPDELDRGVGQGQADRPIADVPSGPYNVTCPRHGRVALDRSQYVAQLERAHEPWGCPICLRPAEWDDETYEAWMERYGPPEIEGAAARRGVIKRINPERLVADARILVQQLGQARDDIVIAKTAVNALAELVDVAEARLTLSPEYAAGKNAEVRSAWLTVAKAEDPDYTSAHDELVMAQMRLAKLEAGYESLGRDYRLALAEMELASAQLRFMAGGA